MPDLARRFFQRNNDHALYQSFIQVTRASTGKNSKLHTIKIGNIHHTSIVIFFHELDTTQTTFFLKLMT